MEIADGIHRIQTPLGDRVNCVYLFVGTRSALLFDTAIGPAITSHVEPYLAGAGVEPGQVRYVVNSHCDWDHPVATARCATWLRRRCSAATNWTGRWSRTPTCSSRAVTTSLPRTASPSRRRPG